MDSLTGTMLVTQNNFYKSHLKKRDDFLFSFFLSEKIGIIKELEKGRAYGYRSF